MKIRNAAIALCLVLAGCVGTPMVEPIPVEVQQLIKQSSLSMHRLEHSHLHTTPAFPWQPTRLGIQSQNAKVEQPSSEMTPATTNHVVAQTPPIAIPSQIKRPPSNGYLKRIVDEYRASNPSEGR